MSAAVILLGEMVLLAVYLRSDATFHWLLHLFVGGSAALVLAALTSQRIDIQALLRFVAAGHVLAALPDILFRLGVAHEHWMDLFAWHLESHFTPGGVVTWYLVFLVCLGANLLLQCRRGSWPALFAALSVGTTVVLSHERIPDVLTSADHPVHLASLVAVPLLAVALVWWSRLRKAPSHPQRGSAA